MKKTFSKITKRQKNKGTFNPTVRIKVPVSAYKRANKKGLLSEFIFWCELKRCNPEGFIQKGEISKTINENTRKSVSRGRSLINRCISLGWIKSSLKGLNIVSYDKVWTSLDIDTESEDFHLFYISSKEKDLKSFISFLEIKKNLKAQQYAYKKKLFKVLKDTEDLTERFLKRFSKKILFENKIRHIKDLKQNVEEGLANPEKVPVNGEITLSSIGIARILGYKSKAQGWHVLGNLESLGYFDVERNRYLTVKRCEDASVAEELPSSFFYKDHYIRKQLPNLITLKLVA